MQSILSLGTLLKGFAQGAWNERRLIWVLSKNDFRAKYAGSLLGFAWAFIQQIVTLAMFYVVFSLGFRSAPVENFPFFLWLCTGMVPWFFFQEAWPKATDALLEYSYLVKRVTFRVSVLPLIRILSSFIVHVFFLVLLVVTYLGYGYWPTIYWLQLLYYVACNFLLLLSVSWITSAVVVFYRDVDQFLSVFLSVLFWMTPICWTPPDGLIRYNPLSYIVEGFRDAMIFQRWFWEKPLETAVFWAYVAVFSVLSGFVFNRLRPHFPEVL